jgi:hypothetical protein
VHRHPRRPPGDTLRGPRADKAGRARLLRRFRSRAPLPVSRSVTTTAASSSPTTSRELAFLGIAPSPAFVREPEGNGFERFIRTLKETLLWVRRFDSIEQLRQTLHALKDTCNRT